LQLKNKKQFRQGSKKKKRKSLKKDRGWKRKKMLLLRENGACLRVVTLLKSMVKVNRYLLMWGSMFVAN